MRLMALTLGHLERRCRPILDDFAKNYRAPPIWRSGKKAMKNKSRCHLLSGFKSAVHCRAAES